MSSASSDDVRQRGARHERSEQDPRRPACLRRTAAGACHAEQCFCRRVDAVGDAVRGGRAARRLRPRQAQHVGCPDRRRDPAQPLVTFADLPSAGRVAAMSAGNIVRDRQRVVGAVEALASARSLPSTTLTAVPSTPAMMPLTMIEMSSSMSAEAVHRRSPRRRRGQPSDLTTSSVSTIAPSGSSTCNVICCSFSDNDADSPHVDVNAVPFQYSTPADVSWCSPSRGTVGLRVRCASRLIGARGRARYAGRGSTRPRSRRR